jgi:hypothetical protein
MDREIVLCQKINNRACGVVLRIYSWSLRGNRCFIENKTGFLFCLESLAAKCVQILCEYQQLLITPEDNREP